jgi:hypothetical protein
MDLTEEIAAEFATLGGALQTWWPLAEDAAFDGLLADADANEIVWH